MKLTWITNVPKSVKSLWPRHAAELIQGDPRPTAHNDVATLKSKGIVGAYVDMPKGEYQKLPRVANPKELTRFLKVQSDISAAVLKLKHEMQLLDLEPDALYLGAAENAILENYTRESLGLNTDVEPNHLGTRREFQGLKVYVVDAASYFQVA